MSCKGVELCCTAHMENFVLSNVMLQTEDLVNEIRKLKDELKKKDETINQLEHQLVSTMLNS